jgi:hypothetical protein
MSTPENRASLAPYLANVLSIAKINGRVAPAESLVLRSIIRRIGATQEDLTAAGKLLASGRYSMQLPESLAVRMDNLQDMVMVALADGDATPKETVPIEKLAKAMHYSQADIDLAVRRAELQLSKLGRRKAPRSKPITAAAPPPIPTARRRESREEPPAPPPVPKARRRSWRTETPKASAPPPPQPPPEMPPEKATPGSDAHHHGSDTMPPSPDIDNTTQDNSIADAQREAPQEQPPETPGMVSDTPMPPPGTKASRVTACAACRAASEAPETYCFGMPEGPINPWGCKLSGLMWEPNAAWLSLGHFRDDVTFVFDKQAIADRLAINLSDALNCPHLDTEYTETAFDNLPARALVGERWDYQHAEADDPDAVTVNTKDYIQGCAVTSKAIVDGVSPIGTRDAQRIIRKTARQLGRNVAL